MLENRIDELLEKTRIKMQGSDEFMSKLTKEELRNEILQVVDNYYKLKERDRFDQAYYENLLNDLEWSDITNKAAEHTFKCEECN